MLWLYDNRMPTIVPVKDRIVFSLRLPKNVYDELDELADREERSLNNMTNVLVKEALRARTERTYTHAQLLTALLRLQRCVKDGKTLHEDGEMLLDRNGGGSDALSMLLGDDQ